MTPRRQQTAPPRVDQPVRVYKFIAVSFLLITIALLIVIVFMSSKRATIIIETKASPVDVTAVAAIGPNKLQGIMGTVTSTRIAASKEFHPTGTRTEPAVATGSVTLHNDSAVDQPLVATTRLVSKDSVLFRLKEGVVVPRHGTVDARVYADKKGAEGNVQPGLFTVPGLPAARQKEVYATSILPMTGGTIEIGIVSQEDIDRAKKILTEELLQHGKQQLLSAYPQYGSQFTVTEDVFEPDVLVGKEVAVFTVKGTVTVIGVLYDTQMMQEWATEKLVRRALSDAEIILPSSEPPVVTVQEVSPDKNEIAAEVFYAGQAMLNPESKQIDKSIFYGKTKDEVRRYVLSLDHVRGVEVKFSPAWMLTVPHIADHVSVIVKNVE